MPKYIILTHRRSRLSAPFDISSSIGVTYAGGLQIDVGDPSFRLDVDELTPSGVLDAVRNPDVAAIAPVMPTQLIAPISSAEPAAAEEAWGVSEIGANTSRFDGAGTVVALLDTGIDRSHDAFRGMELIEKDFTGAGNGDSSGHGTHCAGTIFGRDVLGKRIGVAPGVNKALIGKVISQGAGGDSDMVYLGIQWAMELGAHVISLSLSLDFTGYVSRMVGLGWPVELATSNALTAYRGNLRLFDALMQLVRVRAATRQGVVIVGACGNESKRDVNPAYKLAVSLPAAAEGVLAVGAVMRTGTRLLRVADFSNTFPQLVAPGVEVLSAKAGGGLELQSGTSMACPHVAGAAALWWQALHESSTATANAVMARLLSTALTDVFVEGTDQVDRGMGLARVPT